MRPPSKVPWCITNSICGYKREEVSGITTMMMAEALDTGDMLDQEVVVLDKKETGGSLHEKLSHVGGKLLIKTLKDIEDGTAVFKKAG